MSIRRETAMRLDGLTAINAHTGSPFDLGGLTGVHVLVVLRHRH